MGMKSLSISIIWAYFEVLFKNSFTNYTYCYE